MDHFLKVFIEFVTILLLFYVLVFWPRGMWDLSSSTRDRTCTPCIGRQSLNHWTAREVPQNDVILIGNLRTVRNASMHIQFNKPSGRMDLKRPRLDTGRLGDDCSSPEVGYQELDLEWK